MTVGPQGFSRLEEPQNRLVPVALTGDILKDSMYSPLHFQLPVTVYTSVHPHIVFNNRLYRILFRDAQHLEDCTGFIWEGGKSTLLRYDPNLSKRVELTIPLPSTSVVQLKRCARTIRQEEPSTIKMRLFHEFYQKMDKDYKSRRLVSEYARELSVTASYLNDVIKQVTGHSASYHISQRVIQEAKRQALYSDANMKMVAYSLGFFDPAHFSKFFRRGAGMNFSEFKKGYGRQESISVFKID